MSMPMLKRRWTVDDLEDLPDDGNRYEIIDGELSRDAGAVDESPGGGVAAASHPWRTYLERQPGVGHAYFSPADVTFSRTRSVQPDVFVVPARRRPASTPIRRRRPLTPRRRGALAVHRTRPIASKKRMLFRDESVPEYWVVDLDSRTIERSTPGDSTDRTHRRSDSSGYRKGTAAPPLHDPTSSTTSRRVLERLSPLARGSSAIPCHPSSGSAASIRIADLASSDDS